MADIHQIRPDQPATVDYTPGDVIVDGGGCWWQRYDSRPGRVAWARFGETQLYRLDDLPGPLTLIARAGETTDLARARQTAMALEEQNAELRQAIRDALDEMLPYDLGTDTLAAVLARTDPLRDDS